jgi:hypothetical protein
MLLTGSVLLRTGGLSIAASRSGLRQSTQKSERRLVVWAIKSDLARAEICCESSLGLVTLEQIMKPNSKTSGDERNECPHSDKPSLPAQARQHAPAAIAELVRIIENTRSDAARLAAIRILFDRGLGKAPEALDIAINDRVKPVPPLSPEERKRVVAEFRRFRITGHWSTDDLDDADLEAASSPRAPKEGES